MRDFVMVYFTGVKKFDSTTISFITLEKQKLMIGGVTARKWIYGDSELSYTLSNRSSLFHAQFLVTKQDKIHFSFPSV